MRKMIVLSLLALLLPFAAEAGPTIKDGRQYALDLARRLDVPQQEMLAAFRDLRQNLPKEGDTSALAAGIDAMAKLATVACSSASLFEQDWTDIDGLFERMLDRAPNDEERGQVLRDDQGKPHFFANCFYLAIHPEFITVR